MLGEDAGRRTPATFEGLDVERGNPFVDIFPTDTAGDGKPRKNNLRTGAAQGKSSLIRKAPCQQCGFLVDLSKVNHSGGSYDGNGAGGQITITTETYTLLSGTPVSISYGTQAYAMNAGCPFCFSKNSTRIRRDVTQDQPWDTQVLVGF